MTLTYGFTGTLISFLTIPGQGRSLTTLTEVIATDRGVAGLGYSINILGMLQEEGSTLDQLLDQTFKVSNFEQELRGLENRDTIFLGSEKLIKSNLLKWDVVSK